jgi:hypothetical protein
MSERDITGDVDEVADRAMSGLESTSDEALEEGEDWAQDRTQEGFEEGDVATAGDDALEDIGNA